MTQTLKVVIALLPFNVKWDMFNIYHVYGEQGMKKPYLSII